MKGAPRGAAALYWLPEHADAATELRALRTATGAEAAERMMRLAAHRLDFLAIQTLDHALARARERAEAPALAPVRLALLASATVEHLVPAIRVAALRRGLAVECHVGGYGQHRQELLDEGSALYRFRPAVVLIAIDHQSALPPVALDDDAAAAAAVAERVDDCRALWRLARERLGATVVQQTVPDLTEPLFGNLDSLVPATPASLVDEFNRSLRRAARDDGVLILDLARWVARVGARVWFDPVRWYQAKQEVAPAQAPLYGDLVARILAAQRGLARKCLVLDLDNTLWGGVVGDDGLDGLQLGAGSAQGEAFQAFQRHVKRLAERGVILAVCSKNDQTIAEAAFRDHPEMVLKPDDVAAFVANWDDKATNLQRIAQALAIDLGALVLFDDNPAERALVRQTLPVVAVPEVPDDAAEFATCLADAGYFESVAFTADDAKRTGQYVANVRREEARRRIPDMTSFLTDLAMELVAGPFDRANLPRIIQLVNKTNQFNLTTRRYGEAELAPLIDDRRSVALWFRLKDRFGDNGLISVVIVRPTVDDETTMVIDTWLMSCRVLGRRVEEAVLAVVAEEARKRGAQVLVGEYIPTPKNGLVRDHYAKLGFAAASPGTTEGANRWTLALADLGAPSPIMTVTRAGHD